MINVLIINCGLLPYDVYNVDRLIVGRAMCHYDNGN